MKLLLSATLIAAFILTHGAAAQPANKLYCAQFDDPPSQLYACNLDGTGLTTIPMPLRPKCVAVDWRSSPHKLYVGLVPTSGVGKIIRCNTDGSNPEDVVTTTVGVSDIELDLDNRLVYWTQDTYADDRVYHARMDYTDSAIVQIYATTTAGRNLWALALDVRNHRLWVTERGSTCYDSYIRRMSMSGGSVIIVRSPVCNPHDIEYFDGKIYWSERDGLMSGAPDGTNVDTLFTPAGSDGIGIDGTNRKLYWIDTDHYSLRRIDLDGANVADIITSVGLLSRVESDYNPAAVPVVETPTEPMGWRLLPCYPNPFNPTTNISLTVPARCEHVSVVVYDILGRPCATLVDGTLTAGEHNFTYDASSFSAGVYICRVTAGTFSASQKMILLK